MVEPEIGGERMMRDGRDDAIFERVAGLQAEDACGFDTDVLIRGGVRDGGIGIVGDGAGEDVYEPAAWVRNAHERNLNLLEGAVKVEIEAGELAGAQFVVDFDAGVDFFAA